MLQKLKVKVCRIQWRRAVLTNWTPLISPSSKTQRAFHLVSCHWRQSPFSPSNCFNFQVNRRKTPDHTLECEEGSQRTRSLYCWLCLSLVDRFSDRYLSSGGGCLTMKTSTPMISCNFMSSSNSVYPHRFNGGPRELHGDAEFWISAQRWTWAHHWCNFIISLLYAWLPHGFFRDLML